MRVRAFLESALALERGLESLYRELATHVENEGDVRTFLLRIAEEERLHAGRIRDALSGLTTGETPEIPAPEGMEDVLSMLEDIRDEVRESRLQARDAWEILSHMETFAEERFYGGLPDSVPGLPSELIPYLKGTCAGHAARLLFHPLVP